jgi:hypothetical protein
LDTTRVLDRLISDAYFTERIIKAEAGGMGVSLSKSQLERVKMERDTVLKGVDRRLKAIQVDKLKGSLGDEELILMRKQLESLTVVAPDTVPLPLIEDLDAAQ